MRDPLDPVRRWLGRRLDWCTQPNRPWWHLFRVVPELFALLVISKIIGKVKDDNPIENP